LTDRILVAYASTGFTVGVAGRQLVNLAESGAQVDVRPMVEVKDLNSYQAVVACSAIQDKRWLPEAMQFMQLHRQALSERPCAVFLVCMTLAMKNAGQYRGFVSDFLQPVRALVRPVSEGCSPVGGYHQVPSASDRLKFRLSVLFGV
jgi:menaquinone-dependent protoporphyrinogen oxidase